MDRTVYVFMDASNLWAVQKTKGKLFNFEELINYLKERYKTSSLALYYYDAYPAVGTRSYDTSAKHRFYTFLEKQLGVEVHKKELKRIVSTESKHKDGMIEKGNMDVELTIDAVNKLDHYDTAILFTGDSDFLALVKFIRSNQKKVYIYSSHNNVSTELRTGADGYIDLLTVDNSIWGKDITFRNQSS